MSSPSPWKIVIKQTPGFPDRLDDEFSAISICTDFPASALVDENLRSDTLSVRIILRMRSPEHLGFKADDDGFDIRLEFLDLATMRYPGLSYSLSPQTEKTLAALAPRLGLTLDLTRMSFGNYRIIGRDPGDLPDVYTVDGAAEEAGIHRLHHLSRHAKMAILADPRIELFRLP